MSQQKCFPIHPFFSEQNKAFFDIDKDRSLFVNFAKDDPYGRKGYESGFLKFPFKVPNFLGLCHSDGQKFFDQHDVIKPPLLITSMEVVTTNGDAKSLSFDLAGDYENNNIWETLGKEERFLLDYKIDINLQTNSVSFTELPVVTAFRSSLTASSSGRLLPTFV